MPIEQIELGTTPGNEACAGITEKKELQAEELRVWKDQVIRVISNKCPELAPHVSIKRNNHDFGVYHEVCFAVPSESELEDLAWEMQDELPAYWDAIAIGELSEEYKEKYPPTYSAQTLYKETVTVAEAIACLSQMPQDKILTMADFQPVRLIKSDPTYGDGVIIISDGDEEDFAPDED